MLTVIGAIIALALINEGKLRAPLLGPMGPRVPLGACPGGAGGGVRAEVPLEPREGMTLWEEIW